MTKTDEISKWTRWHIASASYVCDQCGHEIYETMEYRRIVLRERHKDRRKRYLRVHREHGSCPDYCSESHKRY